MQGVETGRLSPDEAIDFLEDEMTNELKDNLKVVELAELSAVAAPDRRPRSPGARLRLA